MTSLTICISRLFTYLVTYLLLVVAQIQFWRVDEPDEVRSNDIILRPPANACPALNIFPEQRRRRQSSEEGFVDNLWPYSTIRAGVLVLNQGSQGELSDTIDFDSPEGGTVRHRGRLTYTLYNYIYTYKT